MPAAADKAVFEIDWAAPQQWIGGRDSQNRVFHIDLLDGRDFKARLLCVEANGRDVQSNNRTVLGAAPRRIDSGPASTP